MLPSPNYNLQTLNSMAVSSTVEYFQRCDSLAQVHESIAWATPKKLRINVLGGGSNVLCAEKIQGLMIQAALKGREIVDESDEHVWVRVSSGEDWHKFVTWCVELGYFGVENLALIPGLVGAAPIQNIGAYGVELCDFFDSLDAVDLNENSVKRFTLADCKFAYRESVFKQELAGKFIITAVTLRLSKQDKPNLTYAALAKSMEVSGTPATAKAVYDAVCRLRASKLPDPLQLPNSGSFFKNPLVSQDEFKRLKQSYPDLVAFDQPSGKKLAAAWLIDKAGWKGKSVGGIVVHAQQALVLTNPKCLAREDILSAAQTIQKDIWRKFGVMLEIEPRILD